MHLRTLFIVCVVFASTFAVMAGQHATAYAGTGTCCVSPQPSHTPFHTPTPKPHGPEKQPGGGQDGNCQTPNQGYNCHAEYEYDLQYLDAYAEVTPNFISSGYPSDSLSFETDELWRIDGSNYAFWQEIGYTTGASNTSSNGFTGLFGAFEEPETGYVEFQIASAPVPSNDPDPSEDEVGVSLAVENSCNTCIDFNYNGHTYGPDNDAQTAYSDAMQIGMESNSSQYQFNPFPSNVDVSNAQVLQSGQKTWAFWPNNGNGLVYYDDSPNNIVICGWAVYNDEQRGTENAASCIYN